MCAGFFAQRNRVTLELQHPRALAFSKCRLRAFSGTQRREFRKRNILPAAKPPQPTTPTQKMSYAEPVGAAQQKRKKPGAAGLFDNHLFRSAHLASLAI
jgi:hypothetical protein